MEKLELPLRQRCAAGWRSCSCPRWRSPAARASAAASRRRVARGPDASRGPDGREYVLLAKGGKPFFDSKGLLERVEYDRNGDGKPDQIARHNGQRTPEAGRERRRLRRRCRQLALLQPGGRAGEDRELPQGGHKPDVWVYSGPDGKPTRQEYDDDGDGKVDRVERLKGDLLDVIEVDADRNGKPDRWQQVGGRKAPIRGPRHRRRRQARPAPALWAQRRGREDGAAHPTLTGSGALPRIPSDFHQVKNGRFRQDLPHRHRGAERRDAATSWTPSTTC